MNDTELQAIIEALERKAKAEGNRVYDEASRASARRMIAAVHFMSQYGLRIGSLATVKLEENHFTYRVKGGEIKQKSLRKNKNFLSVLIILKLPI